MIILSVCSDPTRSAARSSALQSGRFRVIAAQSLPQAWSRADGFEIAAVVLDHEFANDIGAAAFQQSYITLQLNENTTDADLLMELSGLLGKNTSAAVN